MALQLRPNCEYCDVDLPPQAENARICSYECTFCADCVDSHLHNVCPNCGGGLAPRPIRPVRPWREGLCLAAQPASQTRIGLRRGKTEIAAFCEELRAIEPRDR